jgi:two-component system, sensor histidine kinase and response regulator
MSVTQSKKQPLPPAFPVLVAEDNPVNQQVIGLLFKQVSIPVEFASNGEEAVALFSSHHHALILMDIQMPIMDGIEAAHDIRARFPPEQQPAVVALTAEEGENKAHYVALGFNDVLKKPLKPAALKNLLDQYLSHPPNSPENVSPPALSKSPNTIVALDIAVLDEMLADLGEECKDLLVNLIDTFLTHTPTLLAEISQALAENDLHAIHRTAHTLKSSSASLGVLHLSKLSKQLEVRLKPLVKTSLNVQELSKMKGSIRRQLVLMQTAFNQASPGLEAYQTKLMEHSLEDNQG